MTRVVLSIILSAASMFGLAGLWTGVIVKDFIAANVDSALLRNPPDLPVTFLGYLFLSCVMAWAYRRFVPLVENPTLSGMKLGAFFAVAWLMPYTIVLFSIYAFPYKALAIDLPWAFVEQGIGGVVMALIQGRRHHA